MKKVIITLGSMAVIAAVIYAYFMYNKPHTDVEHHKADFIIAADSILNDFMADPSAAAQKYNGKIIITKGTLQSEVIPGSDNKSVLLTDGNATINCELDSTQVTELQGYTPGDPISVKGIFIGFDDLLEELQLNNCYIVKKEESE